MILAAKLHATKTLNNRALDLHRDPLFVELPGPSSTQTRPGNAVSVSISTGSKSTTGWNSAEWRENNYVACSDGFTS